MCRRPLPGHMGSSISDLYTMDADADAVPAANPPAPPVLPNPIAGDQPNLLDIVHQETGQGEGDGEVGITSGAQVLANVAGNAGGPGVKFEAEVAPEIPKAATTTADQSDLSGGGSSAEVPKPEDQMRTQYGQILDQFDPEAMAEKIGKTILRDLAKARGIATDEPRIRQVIRSMIDDAVKDYFGQVIRPMIDDAVKDYFGQVIRPMIDDAVKDYFATNPLKLDDQLDDSSGEDEDEDHLPEVESDENLGFVDSDENLESVDSDENLEDGAVEDDDDEEGQRENAGQKRRASSGSRQNSSKKKSRRVSSSRSSAKKSRRVSSSRSSAGSDQKNRRGRNKGQAPTRQSARIRNAKNNRKK